jgi:hypothetical protein
VSRGRLWRDDHGRAGAEGDHASDGGRVLLPIPFSSSKKDRLGRFKFRVKKQTRSIKVRLPKSSLRRIKRSGETFLEARAAGKAGQEKLSLRKAFPARRR